MNTWPTLKEWWQFGGALALEVGILFLATKLIALRLRSASWRRALWQTVIIAMFIVVMGELNGVRGFLRPRHAPARSVSPQRTVVVTFKDAELPAPLPLDMTSPAPPVTTTQPAAISPWQGRAAWPALAWLAGTLLVASRMLLAQFIALVFRLRCRRMDDADLNARAERIRHTLGVRRGVTLVENQRAIAPFTFGTLWPVIVLPRRFIETFTPEQQEAALLHEMAHVAGFDSAWRGLSDLTGALLWWHPLAWLARRELAHASELAADESSLLLHDGPGRLAECLVACAKELRRPALTTWLGMDGGGFRSALGKRVARLLELSPQVRLSRPVPWYVRLIAPVGCTALLWTGMVMVMKPAAPNSDTWRTSILGNAFAAPAEKPSPTVLSEARKLEIARLVQDGKLSYETGRYDAARTNLQSALEIDPKNQAALYYLDLVNLQLTAVQTRLRELTNSTALHQRFFHLDPNTLQRGLTAIQLPTPTNKISDITNPRSVPLSRTTPAITEVKPAASVIPQLQQWFKSLGVDLTGPGKAIFYSDRMSNMMVRATLQELDTIEKGLQMLNASPQQLTIRVKVMEVPRDNMVSRLAEPLTVEQMRTNAPQSPTLTGILTDEQFRTLVKGYEQRGGEDLLNAPQVTTFSGRQAQIKVVDIKYIVTDLEIKKETPTKEARTPESAVQAERRKAFKSALRSGEAVSVIQQALDDGQTIQPIAEPFALGPIIDVIPYVNADGRTIQMTVLPKLQEFLGYDEDPLKRKEDVQATGGPLASPYVTTPLPKFRLRSVATSAVVQDGQTLVIGAGSAQHLEQKRNADGTTTNTFVEKELFFFITPQLIDAAGNALHSKEEQPFTRKSTPPR